METLNLAVSKREENFKIVADVVDSIEILIGADETAQFLNRLKNFINKSPKSFLDIRKMVVKNKSTIDRLLTPSGILEAGQMIELISECKKPFDDLDNDLDFGEFDD